MKNKWQKRSVNGLILVGVAICLLLFWVALHSMSGVFRWIDEGFVVIETLFTIYVASICMLIFMEQTNPAKTMSWLLVFLAFPLIGFLFYILLGQSFHKKYKAKRKRLQSQATQRRIASIQRDVLDFVENPWFASDLEMRLGRLLLKNSDSPIYLRNKTQAFINGEQTFEAMIKAIRGAKKHIHLEYFIIRNDDIGNIIKEALMERARAGVTVRVIFDSVGSWKLGSRYKDDLIRAGVEVKAFFPVVFPFFRRELNYRNHRKILIVDGSIGFLGGLNIGDEYLGKSQTFGYWRDTHLQIEGEAVYGLQSIFLMDWEYVTAESITSADLYPRYYGDHNERVQIVASGPDSEWESLLQAYLTMIVLAKKSIYIATPYLVPEEGLLLALKTAALSGIDVRILIPEKPDHFFVYWATQANIEDLLKAGVAIYRYQKGFMHSKLILVDGECATVGTANFDIRSLEINFEANAFLYEKHQIVLLEEQYKQDLLDSKEIQYQQFLKRPFQRKLLEAVGRFVSPLQ